MSIEKLLQTNVNGHTEKKNNLTYLSWAWAWAEALKADPAATYKVEMFGDKCYMEINGTAMVWVTVTLFGKPMTCQLPVMDGANKSIPLKGYTATNKYGKEYRVECDSFAVNTAIMRCMTKALSLHGLGLYIYAGEDLPEDGDVPRKGKGAIVTPRGGIGDDLSQEIKDFLTDLAAGTTELVDQGKAKEALAMIDEQALEADQRVWLANQMSSTVRSALKNAKG
jgi:hypothetical protein